MKFQGIIIFLLLQCTLIYKALMKPVLSKKPQKELIVYIFFSESDMSSEKNPKETNARVEPVSSMPTSSKSGSSMRGRMLQGACSVPRTNHGPTLGSSARPTQVSNTRMEAAPQHVETSDGEFLII